jgi:2'-5' RNA ligase
MRRSILIAIVCLASLMDAAFAQAGEAAHVIAINILLLPDQTMRSHAHELNRQLRTNEPQGFAFDDTHVPHISLLHQYVREQDLPSIFAVVQRVLSQHRLNGLELTAKGLEHQSWNDKQVSSISVEKPRELDDVQSELVAALRSYRVQSGDGSAFVTSKSDSRIDPTTINYVATFVEKHTGENFKPHITVGLSNSEFAERLKAEEAARTPIKFKVQDVAVYQLGNVGTARKELWRASASASRR